MLLGPAQFPGELAIRAGGHLGLGPDLVVAIDPDLGPLHVRRQLLTGGLATGLHASPELFDEGQSTIDEPDQLRLLLLGQKKVNHLLFLK
ncbi:MAG: hypothetical protein IIB56_10850 [Planctomycetes bacterium]|nr:hypothetical protein [Planctomycetota bacterium]